MRAHTILAGGFLAAATFFAFAPDALARPVIKNPNDHPDYTAELEPHATFIFWHGRYHNYSRRGYHGFGDPEFGAGFRATIELADPAFIPKINNTVGITFGLDLTNNACRGCFSRNYGYYIWSPVGLQWNFFITDKFSAFADVGFMLRSLGFFDDIYPDLYGMVGGRWHFTDKVSFTFRVGVPFVNLGVSFFVGG
ncbi:MAG TPA: hypothetical protein VE093_17815 [Polyangiaceae bacterium]|jgi:hypothetical protein|nr:hypothetical protein [Polyangiaceae bacterium]